MWNRISDSILVQNYWNNLYSSSKCSVKKYLSTTSGYTFTFFKNIWTHYLLSGLNIFPHYWKELWNSANTYKSWVPLIMMSAFGESHSPSRCSDKLEPDRDISHNLLHDFVQNEDCVEEFATPALHFPWMLAHMKHCRSWWEFIFTETFTPEELMLSSHWNRRGQSGRSQTRNKKMPRQTVRQIMK